MPEASVRIFISYARADGDFVDTLQADLQARNFDAWVDRRKLEGGRDWATMIESAIDRCQVLLVVLSPNALESDWVRREYSYAQDTKKRVVPILYRNIVRTPLRLNEIQWIDFKENYDQGIRDLLIALTPIAALPESPPPVIPPSETTLMNETDEEPDLVAPRPAPPPPNPNLNVLYTQGLEASLDNDLERAAILWGQVLEQDPTFNNGSLSKQMVGLNQNLRPIRIQRLRDRALEAVQTEDWRQAAGAWRALLELVPNDQQAQQGLRDSLRSRAKKAHRDGLWGEEIGAWEALQLLEPNDPQAQERIPVAEQNQRWEFKYQSAQEFEKADKLAPAKEELKLLWENAPYYGDPAHIAENLGVAIPPSFEVVKAERQREEQRQREIELARVQREQKIAELRDSAETKRQEGKWIEEIAAWRELLQLDAVDEQARERIPIAEQNQQYANSYERITEYSKGGLTYSAVNELKDLWERAPYYGDPAGIAPLLNIAVPPSYEELKKTNPDQIKENDNREQERKKQEEEEAAKKAKQEEERLAFKEKHNSRAYFVKYAIQTNTAYVCLGSVFLLGGIGTLVGIYTQMSLYALFTVAGISVIAYVYALRKALRIDLMLLTSIGNAGIAFGLTWLLTQIFHLQSDTNHLWIVGARTLWLGRQLNFGLLIGVIMGLFWSMIYGDLVTLVEGQDRWGSLIGNSFLVSLILGGIGWLIIAFVATIFNWGFGFGYGWEVSLFGTFILGIVAAIGIAATWIIGNPAFQKRYTD